MTANKKKIRKIAGWISLLLIMLLIAALIVIWIKIPGTVIKNLSDYVNEKSEGLYSLSISNMKHSLFPFSINFIDINLTLNEDLLLSDQNKKDKTYYSFEASDVVVEGIDLYALFRNKKFYCDKIQIIKPAIKLTGEELIYNDSLSMVSSLVSEVRPLFRYLKEINIKKIELEEANFGFYKAASSTIISQADKVSLDVLGFRTDSAMINLENQYFETDDILIRMNNITNPMGDNLHVLTIDTLIYSFKTTDIRAAGFNLLPITKNHEENLFEVTVPEVYIKSQSITRFALNDSLKVSFIEFINPQIRFLQKMNPAQLKLEDIRNINLYSLIQNRFSKLEVDTLHLKNGHLEIFKQPDSIRFQQSFKSIDITMNGFLLDSTSADNNQKVFHADDIEMKVEGYQLILEDNAHQFNAESLYVSSFSNRIGLKEIKILPLNPDEINSRTEVNIECQELNMEEVDLRTLYHNRSMTTSKIEIIEPDVDFLYHLEKEKQVKKEEVGLLFELVTDYLKGVYSELVNIENGKLDIKNSMNGMLHGYFETSIYFSLSDFALDSTSLNNSDRFFYATSFDLHFSNYNMRLIDDLHKLKVDNIYISGVNQRVRIENLDLQPVFADVNLADMQRYNRSKLFHITVPEIDLNGIDLRNAYFNKNLKISSFNISNPEIYFENFGSINDGKNKLEIDEFYQLVFNYLKDLDIKKFLVPNGKITWVNHTRKGKTTSFDNEFSASLENFRLNENELPQKRLLFSENFDITVKDQEFELSDKVHVFKGSEIRFTSSNSTINIKNALLFPLITSENYSNLATTFQVAIPRLKIEGFDLQEAWNSREPVIKRIEIISPHFQIYNQTEKTKPLDLNIYKVPMPDFAESLYVKEFKITDARAVTYKTTGINHRAQANFEFDFSMPGFMLQNNSENQIQLTNENILLSISDFRAPLDKSHNLNIDNIRFDRKEKSISVSGLSVRPFLTAPAQNQFIIYAPQINFSKFELKTVLDEQSFDFNSIDVDNSEISIELNQEIKDDTLEFLQTLDFYPYVEHLVNRIKVGKLNINNVNLELNWLQKPIFNNKISLHFNDILLDKNQPPSNFLNSKEFEISTGKLSGKSKNGLYEFKLDSMIYNSLEHRVLLTNLGVNPLIKKDAFPLQSGFQTDVIQANIQFAELYGINEKRWLQENVLDAEKLKIGPAQIEIFRNKRFPFNQAQRPAWPQDLIQNMEPSFIFDSVFLMPSNILYSELMGISDQPGFISFNDLSFAGDKFTNIKNTSQKNTPFELKVQANLLQQAQINVHFEFDLFSPQYKHSVKGSLQPMPLNSFNSIISKSAPIAIEDGKLTRLEFDILFDDQMAEGQLYFEYENLKIAVLDFSNDKIQKARFASFMANTFSVNSNHTNENNPEPVKINYAHDKQRSIINYWWKSVYSGVKEVLGLQP